MILSGQLATKASESQVDRTPSANLSLRVENKPNGPWSAVAF
jgi:hypothetical protein